MTENIGVITYGIAAAAFLILALLIIGAWRGRFQGGLLFTACLVSAVWAAVLAYQASLDYPRMFAADAATIARNAVWFVFLLALLGYPRRHDSRVVGGLGVLAVGVIAVVGVATGYIYIAPEAWGALAAVVALGFGPLMVALVGVVLVEQVYRNTTPNQRWGIKYLCLGLGGLFAYDFYLYADALLFARIEGGAWEARGIVNALIVPLIGITAARNPTWSVELSLSRRMLFHSAALTAAGAYLLLMAVAGYYIQFFGGDWGAVLQATFLFGALVFLLVVLFSGAVRARLRVLLSKHFFRYKYDYRDEWSRFIGTLSSEEADEPLRVRAIQAMCDIMDSPGGMLWTRRGESDLTLTGTLNVGEPGYLVEPAESAFVRFLEDREWVLDIDEFRDVPGRHVGLNALPSWLENMPRAWLVVPLMLGKTLKGFVVLTRPIAPRHVNWEDRDLLKMAGRQAASYIGLLDATEALVDAHQFDAFNRLSAYVVHDLKNVSAQLSLIVSNAERYKHNPEFVDDMIRTVRNATDRMDRMLAQLRKGESSHRESVELCLDTLLRETVEARAEHQPRPRLQDSNDNLRVVANRDRLSSVLTHLVQNAQEATSDDGEVVLNLCRDGDWALIEIKDDGCGMDEAFIRNRLFRPFQTTKGNAGMGVGVYESREIVQSLGGSIEVSSKSGEGTTFTIRLPLAERDVPADRATVSDISEAALGTTNAKTAYSRG